MRDQAWRKVDFPGGLRLHTVSVAPDGLVYITDIRGSVWRGREDTWECLVQADNQLPYQDAAWFDGRLWCTNDSAGCFVLEGGAMVPAHRTRNRPMPVGTAVHAHRIDVAPDGRTALFAGMHGATLFDGKTWNVLFDGAPEA